MVIVENLINLDKIPEGVFVFSALPLKIQNGDGSPIRAVAICE
jgi:kynurenine formamidase